MVPMLPATIVPITPTISDTRAPKISRLSTSRPWKSVPSSAARVGALDPERRLEDLGAGDRLGRVVGRDRRWRTPRSARTAPGSPAATPAIGRQSAASAAAGRRARRAAAGEDRVVCSVTKAMASPIWSGGCGGRCRRRGCRSIRLISTIMMPASMTTPCTSGKSRWKMPS